MEKSASPPKIKGSLLLGNTKEFASNTVGFINDCIAEHEDVVKIKIKFGDWFIMFSPSSINHVLQLNHRNYKQSKAYEIMGDFLGDSLVTTDNEEWQTRRKVVQPFFLKEYISQYSKILIDIVEEKIQYWNNKNLPVEIDLSEEIRQIAQQALCSTILGSSTGAAAKNIGTYLKSFQVYTYKKLRSPIKLPMFFPTKVNKDFKESLSEINLLIEKIINESLSENETNFVKNLKARYEEEEGKVVTNKQLRDEILTLFVGGQETTAYAIIFTFYLLLKNRDKLSILAKELESVSIQDIKNGYNLRSLEYLNQVIHESLRLYPPIWAISRTAKEDDIVDGYHIPKGSSIFVSIYGLHRNKKFWIDPDAFKPERFSPENMSSIKGAFLPFGKGPRNCVGGNFGLMEIQVVLILLIKAFKIELIGNDEMELTNYISLRPKNSIYVSLSKKDE